MNSKEFYIHIFPFEKFTLPFLEFIEEQFNIKKHRFAILESDQNNQFRSKSYYRQKIIYIPKFAFDIFRAKKIIFHSYLGRPKVLILLLTTFKYLRKKCVWVIWGGDLYNEMGKAIIPSKTDKSYLKKKRLISKFGGIATLIPQDYTIAQKLYQVEGEYLEAIYISTIVKYLKNSFVKDDDNTTILVGNSATRSNRHFQVLKALKLFENENIKVIVPLSYGDTEYAKEVVELGRKLLGNKFIPLLEFLNPNEYAKIMQLVDIGIFNMQRQQALDNIYFLLLNNKKVYINANGFMWNYFKETLGLDVYNTESLETINFDVLISPVINNRNKNIVKKHLSQHRIFKVWKNIFEG